MPGVQQQAPPGSERSLQPERRRDKATGRYGNHRDPKRLWTACKTHDSGQRCVKQESPGFSRREVQMPDSTNASVRWLKSISSTRALLSGRVLMVTESF